MIINTKTTLTIYKNDFSWFILTENDDGTKSQVNFVSGIEFLECKKLHHKALKSYLL